MKKPKETPKPKSKAPLLLPEALEKLARDAYCFNPEHDKEIERLNGEVDRLKAQIGLLEAGKSGVMKDIEGRMAQREAELRAQKTEIQYQVEEAQKRTAEVQEDLNDANAKILDLEAKFASSEDIFKKKFRDKSLCFDIMHRMVQGRAMHIMTVPELFIFGIRLLSRPPNSDDDILVAVTTSMVADVEASKRVVDVHQARRLGEDLRKHPLMASLQKDANRGFDYGCPDKVKNR